MAGDEDARIVNAASLSKQLVERVLAERMRQVETDRVRRRRWSPRRARAAKYRASAGFRRRPIPKLEEMFKATRSQQVDDSAPKLSRAISFPSSTSPK